MFNHDRLCGGKGWAVRFCSGLLLIALACSAGCGQQASDHPELGTVSGVVTLDGQPLAGAQVRFYPAKGRPSVAESDANGRYTLMYNAETEGALLGEHRVTVSSIVEGRDDPKNEKVPAKYNTESTLKQTVAAGANTIDLALESK